MIPAIARPSSTATSRTAATRPRAGVRRLWPGSSSVWLHLGLLGPRRVEMGDAGNYDVIVNNGYGSDTSAVALAAALNAETEPPPGTGVPEAVFSKKAVIF